MSSSKRSLPVTISLGTIKDLIVAHLIATTHIKDNEEVISFVFKAPAKEGVELVPLHLELESIKEVKRIDYYGTEG